MSAQPVASLRVCLADAIHARPLGAGAELSFAVASGAEPAPQRATTSADGCAELARAEAPALLSVRQLGYGTVLDEPIPAGAASWTLELLPERTVSGIVTDDRGGPLAGVAIEIAGRAHDGRDVGISADRLSAVRARLSTDPYTLITDARGRYALAGLPGGWINLTFKKAGYAPCEVQAVSATTNAGLERETGAVRPSVTATTPAPSPPATDAALGRTHASLQGWLTAFDGLPLVGAQLWLHGQGVSKRTRSQIRGYFAFANVPLGDLTLSVSHRYIEPSDQSLLSLLRFARPGQPLTLFVGRPLVRGVLTGKVLDAAGKSVRGAQVTLVPISTVSYLVPDAPLRVDRVQVADWTHAVTAATGGRFTIQAAPGDYAVVARRAPGQPQGERLPVSVVERKTRSGLTPRLRQ